MKNLLELQDAITKLSTKLRNSGKSKTADYFDSVLLEMKNVAVESELKEILERIMRSGSITQYANFSHDEEQLFVKIFEFSKAALQDKSVSKQTLI